MGVIHIDLTGEEETFEKGFGKEGKKCDGCSNCTCGKDVKTEGYDLGLELRYEDSLMLIPQTYREKWIKWSGR